VLGGERLSGNRRSVSNGPSHGTLDRPQAPRRARLEDIDSSAAMVDAMNLQGALMMLPEADDPKNAERARTEDFI